MKYPKIVFFGTGTVSQATADALFQSFEIEAVITKTDRKISGKLVPTPMKSWAAEHNIQVYEIDTKSELDTLLQQTTFESQVGIIVDYGVIVSQFAIDSFPKGIINSHFSLLPRLRGADPITFSILNRDNVTGVSVMLINPELDAGPLLAQDELPLSQSETTPELTAKLIQLSNTMLAKVIPEYLTGHCEAYPQPDKPVSYTRMLTKADGLLDFNKSAEELEAEIRAFTGWPTSYFFINEERVVAQEVSISAESLAPKQIEIIDQSRLLIGTATTALEFMLLKPAGKKQMDTQSFINGRPHLPQQVD